MDLERTSLEKAKIEKEGIDQFLKAVNEKGIELHDLILVRGDKVCYEAQWLPYRKEDMHMLYSLSKVFTALAVGFAVQEGLLSTGDAVVSFFDAELPEYLTENTKKMKIEHLLTMSTGQESEPPILNYEVEGNWVRKFLEIEPSYEPGTHFFYDTTATYMLSAILTKVTGETVVDYLKPRFFEPLGIADYAWDESPQGNSLGGIGFNVTIETVAKLGVFLKQEGTWQGKQILNRDWMKRMTSNLINSAGGDVYDDGDNWGYGYGYQIWQCIPDGAYRGDGAYGQFAIVAPKENLVIATLTGTEDMGGLMDAMWKYLFPACKPVDNDSIKKDVSVKELFYVSYPEGKQKSDISVAGTYQMEKNEENIERIVIEEEKDVIHITCFFAGGETRTLAYGYEQWEENRIAGVKYASYYTCGDIRMVNTAGAYAWENDRLCLKLCYLNGPLGVTAEIGFKGDKIKIQAEKHRSMAMKTKYEFDGVRIMSE